MLRAIISRCLTKEPGQRYQRAGEVRAALEAMQTDVLPTSLPPVGAARRAWQPWAAAGLAGGTVIALVTWMLGHRAAGPGNAAAPAET